MEEWLKMVLVSGLLREREEHGELIGVDAHRNLLGIDPICSPP